MKHGMLTIGPEASEHGNAGGNSPHEGSDQHDAYGHDEHGEGERSGSGTIIVVTLMTFLSLIAGLKLAGGFFG